MLDQLSEQDRRDWELYIQKVLNSPVKIMPSNYKQIELPKRLDLHGLTLHEAYHRFNTFVHQHSEIGKSEVVVITGKSGQISREFTNWCRQTHCVKKWEPVVDSRGGVGSYRVYVVAKNK